ncbi:inner membrane transport permease YbhS [Clostridium puniceum]|uniref:Inner membrane transport permease YbhS n=1 Tax=Clostridium puniceum TaxID=29367 RepID=A0A1S8TYC1_9CLOT|nr:ABC transporter permease [Clostridium puniceum]OOM82592.1 inner membrane transport permease YbhS [Clostridium puniceum]
MLISESDVTVNMKETVVKFKNLFLRFKEIIISIILILIIPSISSYILGYTYSAHVVKNIPTVIVDHDNSSLSENFVGQINTNEVFKVTNYSDSDNDIKNLMDRGNVVVGIIIPQEFSKDLFAGKAPKIMILYDGAQMSAVSAAKTRIAEILGTIKASYLIKIGESKLGLMPEVVKNNIIPIQSNAIFVGNPTKSTANFIIQGMLIGIAQTGIIVLGVLMVKEKENYLLLLIKSIGFGLIGAISILLPLIIQFKYFGMPYKGSIMAAATLTILFSITTINLGVLFKLIAKNKLSAVSTSTMIISSTVLLSGYTFPLMAMPNLFKNISKIIPFLYYGIPMRDLSLLGLSFHDVLPQLYYLVQYMIFTWIAILVILIIKRVLKRNYNLKKEIWNKVMHRRNGDESSKVHN